jgi:hypothetical protein
LKSRLLGVDNRLLEDELYKMAWEEIERGVLDPASQARSIVDGEGDDGKTRAAYIKHRVRRLRDELEIIQSQEKEQVRKKQIQEKEQARRKKAYASTPPKDPAERYKWANRLPPYDDW